MISSSQLQAASSSLSITASHLDQYHHSILSGPASSQHPISIIMVKEEKAKLLDEENNKNPTSDVAGKAISAGAPILLKLLKIVLLLSTAALLFLNLLQLPDLLLCNPLYHHVLTKIRTQALLSEKNNQEIIPPPLKEIITQLQSFQTDLDSKKLIDQISALSLKFNTDQLTNELKVSNIENDIILIKNLSQVINPTINETKSKFIAAVNDLTKEISTLPKELAERTSTLKLTEKLRADAWYIFPEFSNAIKNRIYSNKDLMLERHNCKENKIEAKEMTVELNNRNKSREAIFFIYPCRSGYIKPRIVCSVESAAKINPDSDIYLLLSYLPEPNVNKMINGALDMVLKTYNNIKILSIDFTKLLSNTALSNILPKMTGRYSFEHSKYIISALTIALYGGKYIDIDIITIKNITKNFIIVDAGEKFNPNAFGFGTPNWNVTSVMLNILNSSFDPNLWSWNGDEVLKGILGMVDLTGVTKIEGKMVAPFNDTEVLGLFNETQGKGLTGEEWLKKLDPGVWGVKVKDDLVRSQVVPLGSEQPYGLLAKYACPRSYWAAYQDF